MRDIRLQNITKLYDGEKILDDVSLTIPGGTFFALLGPSGSGKTTLLRLIAGFETADGGVISLGSEDITRMPIYQRSVNTVFQNYALFPHLNVFDNVSYPLKIKKKEQADIEEKVVKTLKKVGLEKHMYKSIHQLSGGQQQRVALARAIINEPEVLLLDEPLAALDFSLREKMLLELIELQDSLHTTFVYVTHDQLEALTVADSMAIMNADGEIEQVGSPKQVYEFPTSSFVASFVGSTNLLPGILQNTLDKQFIVIDDLGSFSCLVEQKPWMQDGSNAIMSLRPEKIEISKRQLEGFSNYLTGTVVAIIYHGRSTQYKVLLSNGYKMDVFEQNEEHFEQESIDYDDIVYLCWQRENVVLLEK